MLKPDFLPIAQERNLFMKQKAPQPRRSVQQWLREEKWTCIVLLVAVLIFAAARVWAVSGTAPGTDEDTATEYAEYETGVIRQILADNTESDPTADGGYRGEQLLLVDITSGRYKGETMQVYNYVGPLYGVPLDEGDGVTLILSTYADGSHTGTVYEYNRAVPLLIVLALFLAVTVVVGGKTGVKSLVGLLVTLACLFLVLIPLLMKGLPTLPTTFLICAYVAVVSLTIIGGVRRKTVCAMLGAIAGTALALLFGLAAQAITRIDGLRISDVEPLLQLRQQGVPIGLRGLLVGSIVISALGAVMDVTMGIASSLSEVHDANPGLTRRELFRSGMNIGRDMVGTMTNTLILAFIGSGFTLILYLYSLGLSFHQLLSSAYLSLEVVSGISSSVGVILSIPITALISAVLLTKKV